MLTRTGFKPKSRPERVRPIVARLTVPVNMARISGEVVTCPKSPRAENKHLRDMASGMPCLLRAPVCNNDTDTVISAHSNQSRHGKAKGLKAHDQYTVWACARCHGWLDQSYTATRAEKIAAFDAGHARQVAMWETIATDPRESPADRKAAQWALDELA